MELAKHIDSYVNNGDESLEPRDNGGVPRSKSCTYCAYVTFMSKCNFYFCNYISFIFYNCHI